MSDEKFDIIGAFLSEDEIVELTGYRLGAKQKQFCEENNIKFYMAGAPRKKLKVLRRDAEAFLK